MASIKSENVDQWLDILNGLLENRKELFAKSIYPGAKIVADECRRRIDSLQVDNTLFAWNPMRKGITGGWKKALQNSMGIAKLRKATDGWDVKLGFDGYSNIQENAGYVNGEKQTKYNSSKNPDHMIPNAVIARTTEKGNGTNLPAQPFMAQTVSATEYAASKAIEKEFIKLVNNYIKG